MCDDFIHSSVVSGGPDGVTAAVRQRLLCALERALFTYGKSLKEAVFAQLPQIEETIEDLDVDVEQFIIDGDDLAARVRSHCKDCVCADGPTE